MDLQEQHQAVHTQVAAVSLFDTTIDVKKYSCSYNKQQSEKLDPYVNLYIKTTDICQANCQFCEFHKATGKQFDLDKLKEVVQELNDRDIEINKINFTGGEPMLNPEIMEEALSIVPDTYITINTNGFNWGKTIELSDKITCISLSRHHYNDAINSSIFKTNTPTLNDIEKFPDKVKLHARCNMIAGYIDCQEEAIKYIDTLADKGVMDFGFVSLMKINSFCEENFIDHSILQWGKTGRTHICYEQDRFGVCSCKNFLYYTEKGQLVKMYSRVNEDFTYEASNLVFDIDTLKQGFSGKIIYG